MQIIRKSDVPIETSEGPTILGNYTVALFSDVGGLTQFGAFTEPCCPGRNHPTNIGT